MPIATPLPRRHFLLLLPLPALGACSVVPSPAYREVRRYALAPERPGREPPPRGGPVLLVRGVRAAPGMDSRGLRTVGAGGQVETAAYDEWTAAPAELVEEATRRWLEGSGLFGAVVAPGSRLDADLVLEAELLRLQAEPRAGVARAGLAALLLSEPRNGRQARILGQFTPEGTAPLPAGGGGARGEGAAPVDAAAAAAAMRGAVAEALAALERDLRGAVRGRR